MLPFERALRFIAERGGRICNYHRSQQIYIATAISFQAQILLLSNQCSGVCKSLSNRIALSEFALIVTDLHGTNIKYAEEEKGRGQGKIGGQQATARSPLCTALSLLRTGIYTRIIPSPALLLPGFVPKSKASVWNKLRFSLLQPPYEVDDSLYPFVFCWSLGAFSRSLLCTPLQKALLPPKNSQAKITWRCNKQIKCIGNRLGNTCWVLLRHSRSRDLNLDSSLTLASGLLSVNQGQSGSKDFSA